MKAARWLAHDTRSRRRLVGLAIYLGCFTIFGLVAADRMVVHTPYNHYAHQADAWLHGRHHLVGGPPSYAGGNDFALFEGKWFISFPPLPAILMMPLVWLSGSPENFRDGQFIVWLAGIGPAVLFLILEKLRRSGRSERTEIDNVRLSLLFAFGTVYFFTAVQGTVWFAAHVVGVGALALFVLFAIDAEKPALAGAMLGCAFLSRPTTALVGVLFALEAIRVSYMRHSGKPERALPTEGAFTERFKEVFNNLDTKVLTGLVVRFAVPLVVCLAFASWLNHERFRDWSPSAFGHEHLQIGWKARIDRWGLVSTHFLPRNLSVMLASLPWKPAPSDPPAVLTILGAPRKIPHYMISGHGLALWFTTPFYFWLMRARRVDWVWAACGLAALGPLVMNLLYQNSGWFQFGYRFSNDYSILLFAMLAMGIRRLGVRFWTAATFAVALNLFGALSFEREKFSQFYSHEAAAPSGRYGGRSTLDIVYPPD